jgi:flagellar basal-body rod protein FlgB
MDPNQIGLFALAERRLAWADRRQTLLAQNIANADTPGWRSRDLKPFAELLSTKIPPITPTLTNPAHMAAPRAVSGAEKSRGERAPDGNSVRLDVELSRVADTETAQSFATGIFTKYAGMFRLALGR